MLSHRMADCGGSAPGQAEAARKQPIKERILTADERAEYIAASERITAEDLLKRVG